MLPWAEWMMVHIATHRVPPHNLQEDPILVVLQGPPRLLTTLILQIFVTRTGPRPPERNAVLAGEV